MADLLQEIMDDMRADRATDLWRRHGRWVIYAAVSIVLVTAAMVYGKHHRQNAAMKNTAHYFKASEWLAKGDAQAAQGALAQIKTSDTSYEGLVMLKDAQAYAMLGDAAASDKILAALAAHDDAYGSVAKILLKKNESAPKETAPLILSQQEWAAWQALAAGSEAEAAKGFEALADAEHAPQTLRERTKMMAQYLRNKTGR